ncbi:lytic murein transglycosylase [Mangrovibrevibacter kandeliae]|uniref:lytic murein transglycosylase n=1 Tax=Mangrovibrevibacter kandeliae TaxID=2968473 RepID=UPI0021175B26|nr:MULTISPECIES: lytic murein transglycosylase [unclassified Aurantimonas]MCQ8783950.1 lytic murein transglycosylase [Aurantimonas sp. CSK15Z-1]MCW4116667.1 lytic murein transglycosylase [Aurantimonas sp. MSK8Z-1]
MPAARILAATVALLAGSASLAVAAPQCGGSFDAFLDGVRAEARADGITEPAIDEATAAMHLDQKVLSRDRGQGVFTQTWGEFSKRMISNNRLERGQANLKKYASLFRTIEAQTGVPGAVITAFWGLETDFGAVLGDFDTLPALATLAHDCRRPEMFRPHLIAAIRLVEAGYTRPSEMKGAWAGEIGQTQLLPEEYLQFGTDADGDGKIDLRNSSPDALMTTGKYIASLGWRKGEPWLEEVRVPANFPFDRAALVSKEPRSEFASLGVTKANGAPLESDAVPASLVLPMGRGGPAFLAFPNFDVYLTWNKSLVYTLTAAYFATRLDGAPPVDMGSPEPGLGGDDMKRLQQKLAAKGYDVGEIDGILGEGTRGAVRKEQIRLGLPADGWPTQKLLGALD